MYCIFCFVISMELTSIITLMFFKLTPGLRIPLLRAIKPFTSFECIASSATFISLKLSSQHSAARHRGLTAGTN